ncbi:uncharacterized protein LOC127729396 isoform X3 [Mytilus californianus]|nr:uncharacterized protein LOC127729396 isoform X3 [Mytilus californianus]
MSELGSLSKTKTKKEIKSRFSDRNVPKSKSLCTLETNIDDENDETPRPGTLGRVPSVHELRVTKSLQKLNIPDWYKKSSVSRSGSTWSLYSSPRKDSISSSSYAYPPSITSSPCPSVSFGSNSVVIRTRVTPSSAKLFRTPKLQTTPEKSPTPISVQLPSEKLRQKDKPKDLMPIPIVPFSKLRLMFEESSRKRLPTALATSPSPTSTTAKSIESPTTPISPSSVTSITSQIKSTAAPEILATKPIIPAKPILKKTTENKNVGRVEPEPRQTVPVSVQPMSTSPRSGRRVETTFNGTVGQAEKPQYNRSFDDVVSKIVKECPIFTGSSQHSDMVENLLTVDTPNIHCHKTYTGIHNERDNESLHKKCKSLEDVIDGLLAIEKRCRSSDDILSRRNSVPYSRELDHDSEIYNKHNTFSSNSHNEIKPLVKNNDHFNIVRQTVFCENCREVTYLQDAKDYYITCHFCSTYYCSRLCRGEDWYIHKCSCIYGRISDLCKRVIKFCNKNPDMQFHLSQIARIGFSEKGKGCVKLTFRESWSGESFCNFGHSYLQEQPTYITQQCFRDDVHVSQAFAELNTAVKNYNPNLKYVILVSVSNPTQSSFNKSGNYSSVQRCAKLRLCPIIMHPKPEMDLQSVLILHFVTTVNRYSSSSQMDDRHAREICFINIQRILRERGVILRHCYPKIYRKLIDFVADGKRFSPITFYPFDTKKKKHYVCIIIPESDPEIEWVRDQYLCSENGVMETLHEDFIYNRNDT